MLEFVVVYVGLKFDLNGFKGLFYKVLKFD